MDDPSRNISDILFVVEFEYKIKSLGKYLGVTLFNNFN